jgi:PKD repeat protein
MVDTVVGSSPGWVDGAWPLGDFHLAAGSPCINAGTNSVGDLPTKEYDHPCGWVTRPTDSAIDIGAYEYVGGPALPVADFSGNPTSGSVPLTVAFTDLSTGSPTSWSWTFGDGGSSTAQHPSHEYTAANAYTVSLTVQNAQGQDTETKPNYITATGGGGPQDYFCASLTVNTGTLKSGDHTSVHASDNTYLVIGSAKSAGKQTVQVSYTFSTGLGSLSSLTATVEGKVSTGSQAVTIYAYNYSTSSWTSVGTGTFTTSDSTLNPTISNPAQYISGGTVQVRVKVGGTGSTAFDNSTDFVKITAAP